MTDTTSVAPPLTRRQAREIERKTGRRPVATIAPSPVFDTARIERNDMAALVSVLPTEVIDRVAAKPLAVVAPVAPADSAFVRLASIRAARPAVVIARSRRRAAAGLGIAASAAVLATAAVAVPGSLQQSDQAAQAALVTSDIVAEGDAQVETAGVTAAGPVVDLVAAPEAVADRAQFAVTSFDAGAVEEAVTDSTVSTGSNTDGSTVTTSGGGSASSSDIIAAAESMLGGGSGWLCTDFTAAVYQAAGIDLRGSFVSQQAAGGTPTSDPQVGDLVVFDSGHIGIYAGGGEMYDNPGFTSSAVGWKNVKRSISVIGSSYYFVTYR